MATYHDGAEIDRSTHSINYTEFTVKKKTEGMLILAKIGLILLYIGIVAVITFVGVMFTKWEYSEDDEAGTLPTMSFFKKK